MNRNRNNWARYYGGRSPLFGRRRSENRLPGGAAPLRGSESSLVRKAGVKEEQTTREAVKGFRSIMVPLDGTSFGEHALPLALGIAKRSGGVVHLVHVHRLLQSIHRPEMLYYDASHDAFLNRQGRAYLNRLMRRLAKVTSVPLIPTFVKGPDVASALARKAGETMDLVVMATHARGFVGRLCLGSVTEELLGRVDLPVVLVRGHQAPVDLTGDPVPRHVAIALDGTQHAEEVIAPALKLGALTNAAQTMLRVVLDEESLTDGSGSKPRPKSLVEKAWSYLENLTGRLGKRASRVSQKIVLDEGPTAQAILRHAHEEDVDLIALTRKKHGWLTRLFKGSVADQVIRNANIPVMVCRANAANENTNG